MIAPVAHPINIPPSISVVITKISKLAPRLIKPNWNKRFAVSLPSLAPSNNAVGLGCSPLAASRNALVRPNDKKGVIKNGTKPPIFGIIAGIRTITTKHNIMTQSGSTAAFVNLKPLTTHCQPSRAATDSIFIKCVDYFVCLIKYARNARGLWGLIVPPVADCTSRQAETTKSAVLPHESSAAKLRFPLRLVV